MKESSFKVGTLLYHLNHGVVRIADILIAKKETGEDVVSYSLLPFKKNAGNIRFEATMAALKKSGFHELATEDEGNQVLQFFRNGVATASLLPDDSKAESVPSEKYKIRDLARSLLSFAFESFDPKDRNNKIRLEQAVKGLLEELSCAFKTSQEETSEKIRKSLGRANMNPLVLAALECS